MVLEDKTKLYRDIRHDAHEARRSTAWGSGGIGIKWAYRVSQRDVNMARKRREANKVAEAETAVACRW